VTSVQGDAVIAALDVMNALLGDLVQLTGVLLVAGAIGATVLVGILVASVLGAGVK